MPEPRPTEAGHSLGVRFAKHPHLTQVAIVVGAYGTYVLLYLMLFARVGPAVAMFAMLPVAVVGWRFGMRAGILAAVLCFPLNLLLMSLVGMDGWHEMTDTGGGSLGIILLVITGGVLGRMSELGRRATRELVARRQVEVALRETEAKYRSIFENAVVGIFQTTLAGQYLIANPTLAHLYGYGSEEELMGTIVNLKSQFYIDPARRGEFIRLVREHGFVADFESQVYCKDKRIIWISETARGVNDAAGNLIGFEGTAIDITVQKGSFAQAQERLARLDALHEIDAAIFANHGIEQTLDTVLEKVTERLQVDTTAIALVEKTTGELTYAARRGLDVEFFGSGLVIGEDIVGEVVSSGNPIAIADVSTEPRFVRRAIAMEMGIVSYLAVPLRTGNGIIGVLEVTMRKPILFTPEEVGFDVTLARQAALAIENARLSREEKTRRQELGVLYEFSRALADVADDLNLILKLIVRHAAEITHVTFARLVLLEDGQCVVRATHPVRHLDHVEPYQRFAIEDLPVCQRTLQQNEPQVLCRTDPDLSDLEKSVLSLESSETICLVPLRVGASSSCDSDFECQEPALGLLILGEMRRVEREPFTADKRRLAHNIGDQAASAIRRARLFAELENSYLQTVLSLANAVEAKDTYTADHAQRLAQMGLAIGRDLQMPARELEDLRYGAILHDIGKIGIPDAILLKPSKLDADEWKCMREHPVIGERILAPIPRMAGAALLVRHHHERFDGKGYPDGLAGDAIPLGARILTVVDSYSAIMDPRVYKAGRSQEVAVAELRRCAGTQFDPRIVEVFLQQMECDPDEAFSPAVAVLQNLT